LRGKDELARFPKRGRIVGEVVTCDYSNEDRKARKLVNGKRNAMTDSWLILLAIERA
jgi:hypothetical protein